MVDLAFDAEVASIGSKRESEEVRKARAESGTGIVEQDLVQNAKALAGDWGKHMGRIREIVGNG